MIDEPTESFLGLHELPVDLRVGEAVVEDVVHRHVESFVQDFYGKVGVAGTIIHCQLGVGNHVQ